MSEKLREMLERAVEHANQSITAIQKGEYRPRIDVIQHGVRADSMSPGSRF